MERAIIFGGSGRLGSVFCNLVADSVAPPRCAVDVTRESDVRRAVASVDPGVMINCAGYNDVDGAEDDEREAYAVNSLAVGVMARIAAERAIPFVTFSSDYVFDGTGDQAYVETSPPNPINVYGRTKALGEEKALAYPDALVIRTSWLLSMTHGNFVTTILGRVGKGPLRVVGDQVGCPTFAEDVATAAIDALGRNVRGILHLSSGPPTSWHGLAQAALSLAGLDPNLAEVCTTEDYGGRADRPKWSVMTSERVGQAGIAPVQSWMGRLPDLVSSLA